jgi:hypothetical protein
MLGLHSGKNRSSEFYNRHEHTLTVPSHKSPFRASSHLLKTASSNNECGAKLYFPQITYFLLRPEMSFNFKERENSFFFAVVLTNKNE